jgi:hypothetical protein
MSTSRVKIICAVNSVPVLDSLLEILLSKVSDFDFIDGLAFPQSGSFVVLLNSSFAIREKFAASKSNWRIDGTSHE